MSEIPSVIFIRNDSESDKDINGNNTDAPSTISVYSYNDYNVNDDDITMITTTTSTTTDDSSRSSYISNQDLAAMKAMVQEIKLNPSLLHSKCNIPQLSHSMTTRHQERMAATTATSIPSCHAAQEQQLEWSRQQWCIDQQQQQQQFHVHGCGDATHHNDQCYHPIHNNCNTNFDSSFEIDRHFPVTPPLPPKSENIHKFPTITPLTQDTALLSYQRHHSIEQQQYEQHRQQKRSSAIPPPPFATSYCQESYTRLTAAMPMPPLSSQIGLDSCGQGQRSTSCHR